MPAKFVPNYKSENSIWRDSMPRGGGDAYQSQAQIGHTIVLVHLDPTRDDGLWMVSCPQLAINCHILVSDSIHQAKIEAIKVLKAKAERHAKDLGYIEERSP